MRQSKLTFLVCLAVFCACGKGRTPHPLPSPTVPPSVDTAAAAVSVESVDSAVPAVSSATAALEIEHLYDIPSTCDASTMTSRHDSLGRPFLYVAAKEGGLRIYDVSGAPVLVGTIPVASMGSLHVMSLFQSGQRLYLALGTHFFGTKQGAGLAVIDVSDPTRAGILGHWKDDAAVGGAGCVEVVGELAYLGAMKSGLYILDVSHPSAIRRVSKFVPEIRFPDARPDPKKFNARGMAVRDGIVYLCYDAGGLRLIDVKNPDRPLEIGRYSNPAMNGKPRAYNNIVLDGRLAYVTVDFVGFEILDISNPSAISLVSWWNPWNPSLQPINWFTSPGHANEIAFDARKKIAFISVGKSDLQVLSVADPVHPQLIGKFGEASDQMGTWGVSIHSDRVYLSYICTLGIPFNSRWTGIKVLRYK